MDLRIRHATSNDVRSIAALLTEADRWVHQHDGTTMWVEGELADDRIAEEVDAGLFVVAEDGERIVGVVRFQLQDTLFWPDLEAATDSAFVHRLAVARDRAGQGLSTALLQWAVDRCRSLGKRYLRLDCDADRLRLRALYERFGFRLHSYRQVGAYFVARYELPIGGNPSASASTESR